MSTVFWPRTCLCHKLITRLQKDFEKMKKDKTDLKKLKAYNQAAEETAAKENRQLEESPEAGSLTAMLQPAQHLLSGDFAKAAVLDYESRSVGLFQVGRLEMNGRTWVAFPQSEADGGKKWKMTDIINLNDWDNRINSQSRNFFFKWFPRQVRYVPNLDLAHLEY